MNRYRSNLLRKLYSSANQFFLVIRHQRLKYNFSKMKIYLCSSLFTFYFLCSKCNFLLNHEILIDKNNEKFIPLEIISNFLQQYLNRKNTFVAVTLSSSCDEQTILQEDMITYLFQYTAINGFSHTISHSVLNSNFQLKRKNRRFLSLIFADPNISWR